MLKLLDLFLILGILYSSKSILYSVRSHDNPNSKLEEEQNTHNILCYILEIQKTHSFSKFLFSDVYCWGAQDESPRNYLFRSWLTIFPQIKSIWLNFLSRNQSGPRWTILRVFLFLVYFCYNFGRSVKFLFLIAADLDFFKLYFVNFHNIIYLGSKIIGCWVCSGSVGTYFIIFPYYFKSFKYCSYYDPVAE